MPFAGLPREMPDFLRRLRGNNDRAWFEANRDAYQTVCVTPMLDLVMALEPLCEALDPPHRAEAKLNGSLRRIHRDTRFSRDKTPYHDHLHLIFWTGGHPTRSAGIHLVFGADGFGMGAGYWAFEGEALERYRDALCDPQAAGEVEAALTEMAAFGMIPDPPALKKPPAGRSAPGLAGELLKSKGLVVRTRENQPYAEDLFGPGALDHLAPRMRAAAYLDRWIARRVAP